VFDAIRDFLAQRRFRKDLGKLHDLTEGFVNEVHDIAAKDKFERDLMFLEVLVLGNFVVSEIYLGLSSDKEYASYVLDEHHELTAHLHFELNLPNLQERFPDKNSDELRKTFMKLYFDKTTERGPEYRSIMQDEQGLFRFSERQFSDLGQHLLKHSSKIDAEVRKAILVFFGVAVAKLVSRSFKLLKH